LKARGDTTIRGLGRVFRIFDNLDGNRKVDRGEFLTGLNEIGVQISKAESDVSPSIYFIMFKFLTYLLIGFAYPL
jgi:hypothetical protein